MKDMRWLCEGARMAISFKLRSVHIIFGYLWGETDIKRSMTVKKEIGCNL